MDGSWLRHIVRCQRMGLVWDRHGILASVTLRIFQSVYWHHWFCDRHYHRPGHTRRCPICDLVVARDLDRAEFSHDLLLVVMDTGRLRHQHPVLVLHDRLGRHYPRSHLGACAKRIARFDQSHTTDEDDNNDGRLADDHSLLCGDRCIDCAALRRSNVLGQLWTKRNSTAWPAPS